MIDGQRRRIVVSAIAGAALLAIAGIWLGGRGSREGASSASRLAPAEAHANAARLELAQQHLKSLAFYRRALEAPELRTWTVRREYAAALNNAAVEVPRSRNGEISATRTSNAARIELVRESLRQVELALGEVVDPGARALLFEDRGKTYEWWGFSWNALQQYDEASRLDPRSGEIRDRAIRCAATMMVDTTARR